MEYIFLLSNDEKRWAAMSQTEAQHEYGAYAAYTQALRDAGVYVGGNPLESTATATSVRVDDQGKRTVLDGTYAETKEQLGGYYVVNVMNLDVAIDWAAQCPCASHGTVEIRPVAHLTAAVP